MKILKILKLILILSIILILFYIGMIVYDNYLVSSQKIVLESIKELKSEIIPVKIKFESFENNRIKYIINFYDLDTKKIGTYKGSINGQILFLDFKVLKVGSFFLFFPIQVFSDTIAPYAGTDITYFYTKNNFPMIYYSNNNSKEFNTLIDSAWKFVNSENQDSNHDFTFNFGNAIHLIQKIEKINLDTIYYYVCHIKKGGIEIIEK